MCQELQRIALFCQSHSLGSKIATTINKSCGCCQPKTSYHDNIKSGEREIIQGNKALRCIFKAILFWDQQSQR